MTQVGITAEFGNESSDRWRHWLLFLLIALLVHIIFFMMKLTWFAPATHAPTPVEIRTVDPSKLESIRRQWKERSLLLDKNKSQPSAKEAPPDARYFSDRNIRVEKEQRAKETQVIPKPGHRTEPQTQSKPKAPTRPAAKLGNLGVPLNLGRASRSIAEAERPQEVAGGDQAVLDRNLPVGSENLLNAQESIYYSFFARLYEAIGPIWQSQIRSVPYHRRVNPGDYSTVVDVVLDRTGRLIGVRRLQTSGIEDFDLAVDLAWKKVGNFPNPPHDLLDQNQEVHTGWTFTVQVGEGFNLHYSRPERNY